MIKRVKKETMSETHTSTVYLLEHMIDVGMRRPGSPLPRPAKQSSHIVLRPSDCLRAIGIGIVVLGLLFGFIIWDIERIADAVAADVALS